MRASVSAVLLPPPAPPAVPLVLARRVRSSSPSILRIVPHPRPSVQARRPLPLRHPVRPLPLPCGPRQGLRCVPVPIYFFRAVPVLLFRAAPPRVLSLSLSYLLLCSPALVLALTNDAALHSPAAGFTITMYEYEATIPTLWETTKGASVSASASPPSIPTLPSLPPSSALRAPADR